MEMNNKLCRKQNESISQQTSSPTTPTTASKDKDKPKRSGSPTITTQSQDTRHQHQEKKIKVIYNISMKKISTNFKSIMTSFNFFTI
jgi:hypothetical protein